MRHDQIAFRNLRVGMNQQIEIDPAHPDAIRTVRGVGYMFVPPKD